MKRTLTIMTAAFALGGTATTVHAQEALAKSSGCLTCHAIDAKKVGPSFKDTAARYKGKPEAEATLVAKLTAGKAHPAVKATPAETKSLVAWILAM